MKILHIDLETYSSEDLGKCGAYKYFESKYFEILMIAYAYGSDPVQVVDMAAGEPIPPELKADLLSENVIKCAHNAAFERLALSRIGLNIPLSSWRCSMVHAGYCGLPLSLADVGVALNFGENVSKSLAGGALIRYFTQPCKPTKTNGGRTRNLFSDDPEKWQAFKDYCARDVDAEREIERKLAKYPVPAREWALYAVDQKINDRGVQIDEGLARGAFKINDIYSEKTKVKIGELSGVNNPNSVPQMTAWVSENLQKPIKSLAKDALQDIIDTCDNALVEKVLTLKQSISKTSVTKYDSMIRGQQSDGRGRGFLQFYGANRTGRWAGRRTQIHNLPRNYLPDLFAARAIVKSGDYDLLNLLYGDPIGVLSELIRTAFIAKPGHLLAVADFAAIEARVTAWLAGETWRLKVFATHGKIYEASAASMFGVPMESVTKGSDLRSKGKIAELALGYQGGVGALKVMGGESMGLSVGDMQEIVTKWRGANGKIVNLWKDFDTSAKHAIKTKKPVKSAGGRVVFDADANYLTITLPSGRKLYYLRPKIAKKTINMQNGDDWDTECIFYEGGAVSQVKDSKGNKKKIVGVLDTYGGKLTENIVQAVSRDILATAMLKVDAAGLPIVLHVHDEMGVEVPEAQADAALKIMLDKMAEPILWADGLILKGDGFITKYYKKDG